MQNLRWTRAHTYKHTYSHTHTELLLAYKISQNWSFLGFCAITLRKLISEIDLPVKFCISWLKYYSKNPNYFLIFSFKQFRENQKYVSNFTSLHYIFIPTVYKYHYREFSHTLNHVDWWTISSCMYIIILLITRSYRFSLLLFFFFKFKIAVNTLYLYDVL